MKKILIVVSAVVVAMIIFGAGFAFAQTQNVFAAASAYLPPSGMMHGGPGGQMGMMGGRGGHGIVHEYIKEALAAKLGITVESLEKEEAAGKSLYQVALDNGVAEADVDAVLTEVHKTAFDKAVADGKLTQAQADAMLARMQGNWQNMGGFDRGGMRMGGKGSSYGPVHDYVEEALAAKLGITVEALEKEQAAGKSLYQVALDNGIAESDIQAVFGEVHKTAFDKAVADGKLTQAQADAMLEKMQARWQDGMPCDENGQARGNGGMRGGKGNRGGRGGQQPAEAPAP